MMRPRLFKFYRPFLILPLILISCASSPVLKEKGVTVAVWYIENLTPFTTVPADLGTMLSTQVMETIKKKGIYEVIERERLDLTLEGLRLGGKKFVDEATRLNVGKMIGARFMVFGGYQIVGDKMRLDLRMVEVETGRAREAVAKTTSATDLSEWMETTRKVEMELL